MRIWTYLRPFSFRDEAYTVEVFFTFTHTVSRLFLGDRRGGWVRVMSRFADSSARAGVRLCCRVLAGGEHAVV